MVTYFWAIGTLFMVLIFAGKAGLVAGSASLRKTKIISLAFLYGILAFLMGILLKVFNAPDYFQFFQKFMFHGILLHIFLSLGLFAWGIYIIKSFANETLMSQTLTKNSENNELDCFASLAMTSTSSLRGAIATKQSTRAGYILMLPCPICLSSMLLSTSIISAITGISVIKASALISLIFIVVIPTSAFLSRHLSPITVGFSMFILGLYFVVSILFVPVYSQYKTIPGLTQSVVKVGLSLEKLILVLGIALLLFVAGYLKTRKEMKK